MTNPTIRFKTANGLDFPDTVSCTLSDISKYSKGTIERKNCIFIGNEQLISNFGGATLEIRTEAKGTEFNSGDILFGNIRPYLKKVWLSDRSGIASPDVLIFKATNSIPGYLKCILSSDRFFNHVAQGYKGSKMPRGDKHQIMGFKIQCPCIEEQQKIAAFFSTLDEKISLSERKLEALEKLKKGLMQKIFSQAIRFKSKDGHDFEDWKILKIDDVALIRGGGTPSTKNEDYWNGNIQWMTPTEINSKYVHSSLRTITKLGLDNSSAKLLPKGAILLTTRATIGACSINNFDGDVCTNQGFQSLICNQNIIPEFLYYSITNPAFQKEMQKNASGSTFLEISSNNLKKLTLQVPSIEEQECISIFFSTFDQKIDLIKAKICALKKLKQGFMQQMFV